MRTTLFLAVLIIADVISTLNKVEVAHTVTFNLILLLILGGFFLMDIVEPLGKRNER